tara:strand:- start:81 stop:353 length:273 start_codon:yes stop_codon:yes gene_type:complete
MSKELYRDDYVLIRGNITNPQWKDVDTDICHISFIKFSLWNSFPKLDINGWSDAKLVDYSNKITNDGWSYVRMIDLPKKIQNKFLKQLEL